MVCITLCTFYFCNHIDEEERERVALLLLPSGYLATVHVLWLFLAVPMMGLQFEAIVFPDHTHLHFEIVRKKT